MAHPLLISLANIAMDIRSKGSLHAHLLLALLPVPSIIHKNSRVRSLLSDRLFHHCLSLVLTPLKIAAAIGVIMNDPRGNLRYFYTPLVGYIADTPEQCLLSCASTRASPMSTATYHQFGDDTRHNPRTAEYILNAISALCSRADPDDFPAFLKVAKEHGLNGVHEPFWMDWPLSDPAQFLKVEPLHHFFRMAWDHDIQWSISVVGGAEIDYRFTLLQTPVGYRSFAEGISKLKQVTGRDHRAIQRYILCVIAGAVPLRFLAAIRAILDFRYLAQMPALDEHALAKLDGALALFHTHKHAILTAGARSEHFRIPKLELMQHVVPSVRASGAPMQWSADVTEHAHVTEIKNPARAGNNQNYYTQIARHLDRSERCFKFDLATSIASHEDPDDSNGPADEDDHKSDDEESDAIHYHKPTCKIVDYFKVAESLAMDTSPNTPRPRRTFVSDTTAIHLATKPHHRMTIDEASALFELPDLRRAIIEYLDRCANGVEHAITGQRHASSESHYSFPSDKIQVWTKVRVQVRNYHDPGIAEPAQTLNISPPSQEHPRGLYDSAVFSPRAESDWPSRGLDGKLIVYIFMLLAHDVQVIWLFNYGSSSACSAPTNSSPMCGVSTSFLLRLGSRPMRRPQVSTF